MFQLRKIRANLSAKGAAKKNVDSPFDPPIEVETLASLFEQLPRLVEKIPPEDRWNIFYTLGASSGDFHRTWHFQNVIPFDIDGVAEEDGSFDEKKYLDVIFGVLGVDRDKCIVVASGNGLQILVEVPKRIDAASYFSLFAPAYKNICVKIATALADAGLRCKEVDVSSFASNRVFRLPGTENRKPERSRQARLILGKLEAQEFFIPCPDLSASADESDRKAAAAAKKKAAAEVSEKQLAFFKIDTQSVETGCDFLKHAKANPQDLNEPQWYAMLSIVGRLEDGRQKAHAYSAGHPNYDERDTDLKLDQAIASSGPRTCDNIDALWGECHKCPFYKKVPSPISLKSDTFIATEFSGFHLLTKTGGLTPQFEDLRRFFHREHPYKTNSKSATVYVYDAGKYSYWSMPQLKNFAHDAFDPKPKDKDAQEFCSWVARTNLIENDWFRVSSRGFINFSNGVLDTSSGELLTHDPARGFLYILPFDFAPGGESPIFDKFMEDVTCGDMMAQQMLKEFLGYIVCDPGDYWLQKALILLGVGSNGKSTFLKIVEMLAGRENISFLALHDLQSETTRSQLEGKLLNICDELPTVNFKSTELLKKLFGGTTSVRRLYQDGSSMENTAKFIFAGNKLPDTNDTSEGFFRRIAIVPFNARFSLNPGPGEKKADTQIIRKIRGELPAIFHKVWGAYQALKKRGYLAEAATSTTEMEYFRTNTDFVGTWVKENLYWNGGYNDDKAPAIAFAAAFERYVNDAERAQERPLTQSNFKTQLRKQLDFFDTRMVRRRTKDGNRPFYLRGVEFSAGVVKADF